MARVVLRLRSMVMESSTTRIVMAMEAPQGCRHAGRGLFPGGLGERWAQSIHRRDWREDEKRMQWVYGAQEWSGLSVFSGRWQGWRRRSIAGAEPCRRRSA